MAEYHTADGTPNSSSRDTPKILRGNRPGCSLEDSHAVIAVDYGTGAACVELSEQQALDIATVLERGKRSIQQSTVLSDMDDDVERKVRALIQTLEGSIEGAHHD